MIYLPLTLFRGKIIISTYDQVIETQIQTNIGYTFSLSTNNYSRHINRPVFLKTVSRTEKIKYFLDRYFKILKKKKERKKCQDLR